jgi:hypothetical protein
MSLDGWTNPFGDYSIEHLEAYVSNKDNLLLDIAQAALDFKKKQALADYADDILRIA